MKSNQLMPDGNQQQEEKDNINKTLHPFIICDCCDGEVVGHRYKCLICQDFDLCERCERTGVHAEHAMMRLVTLDTKVFIN